MDTCSSHNFLWMGLAVEIGIRAQPCEISVKDVNSKVKAVTGVAFNVHMWIRQWEGYSDFMVLPLDDFDLILG